MSSLLTFFQQKISAYTCIIDLNFNESLTKNIVSFEQLGPGVRSACLMWMMPLYLHVNQTSDDDDDDFCFSTRE